MKPLLAVAVLLCFSATAAYLPRHEKKIVESKIPEVIRYDGGENLRSPKVLRRSFEILFATNETARASFQWREIDSVARRCEFTVDLKTQALIQDSILCLQ